MPLFFDKERLDIRVVVSYLTLVGLTGTYVHVV